MTDRTALIEALERAAPSRWIALGCSFGAFSAVMFVSVILEANDMATLSDLANRIAIVCAVLTWWEVRRFKYAAETLRAGSAAK